MKIIRLVAVICAAFSITPVNVAETAQRPSITVRWLADASGDGTAQKGIVTVPVVDPAGDCLSKFQVVGITTWLVQQKGVNDVPDVRSEMSVSLRKLFEGKKPLPELTIVQSVDDLDLPAVISFRGKHAVESESWSAANIDFTERFEAGAIAGPTTWKRIELRCSN